MIQKINQLVSKIKKFSIKDSDNERERFAIMNLNQLLFVESFGLLFFAIVELIYNKEYSLNSFLGYIGLIVYLILNIPLRLKLNHKFVIFSIFLVITLFSLDIYYRPQIYTLTYYLVILTFIPNAFAYKISIKNIIICEVFLTIMVFEALFLNNGNHQKMVIDKPYIIINLIDVTLLLINNLYFLKMNYEQSIISKNEKIKIGMSINDVKESKKQKLVNFGDKNENQNKSIIKITELALQDDPAFMALFKEYYHKFYRNLIQKHPGLNLTELKFCALLYLEFSSKEIASILNIAHRTVQSRKYNLRKKMNLNNHGNIYLLIKNIEKN